MLGNFKDKIKIVLFEWTWMSLLTVEDEEQNDESHAASSNISKVLRSSKSFLWELSAFTSFSMKDSSTES
jgi:hypothetical protein